MMVNILKNSIDALKTDDSPSKRITIATRQARRHDSNCIGIDICDNGRPIPPEYLERIFDPFFTTKDPGEGT
ncbi:MAG: ATP-binding protein, partial [Sediminispirochaetaceae bacterium]